MTTQPHKAYDGTNGTMTLCNGTGNDMTQLTMTHARNNESMQLSIAQDDTQDQGKILAYANEIVGVRDAACIVSGRWATQGRPISGMSTTTHKKNSWGSVDNKTVQSWSCKARCKWQHHRIVP